MVEPTLDALLEILQHGPREENEEYEVQRVLFSLFGSKDLLDPNTIYSLFYCKRNITNKIDEVHKMISSIAMEDARFSPFEDLFFNLSLLITTMRTVLTSPIFRLQDTHHGISNKTYHRRLSRWIRRVHEIGTAIIILKDDEAKKKLKTTVEVRNVLIPDQSGEQDRYTMVRETTELFRVSNDEAEPCQDFVLSRTSESKDVRLYDSSRVRIIEEDEVGEERSTVSTTQLEESVDATEIVDLQANLV